MLYIRKGVYETNSSSSHSIVMTKNDKPSATIGDSGMIDAGWRVDEKGVMDFWYENDLEFGRAPFELLTDWYGRLRYAIASYSGDQEKINEIEEICRCRIAGFTRFKFKEDKWENGEYRGYIDHQSMGVLDAALKKYNVSIDNFIFDDRFIVVIDGDEYRVFETLMETDLFRKEAVEDIVSASWQIEEEYWNERDKEKQ